MWSVTAPSPTSQNNCYTGRETVEVVRNSHSLAPALSPPSISITIKLEYNSLPSMVIVI